MPVDSSITTEGNTVQEAVDKALRVLNIPKEHAKIKILSEGKQGFLGLGAKRAKVTVCLKAEMVAERELTDILDDLDIQDATAEQQAKLKMADRRLGLVEVRDGTVFITDPAVEGKYATIKPGKNVKLKINGKEIEEETYVSGEDKIELELTGDEPVSALELHVSPDKTEACLKLLSSPGAKYELIEQPPTNRLILLAEREKVIEPPPVTLAEVKKYLRDNGIVVGVKEEAVQQVIDNPNREGFLVAEGQKPVNGEDAYIRYPFLENQKENPEEGLFGRYKVLSVTPGEILAIRVPGREGQDGWAVTGEALPAKKPADCEILVKNGCQVIDNGQKAVAEIAGRPGLETLGNKTFLSVDPVYEVKQVNQNSGNIKFTGDVKVQTDVHDGCMIEADGNIEVFGDVTRATLKAGAGVTVHKMVLGSKILAGGRAAVYSSIKPLLSQIKELLVKMFGVAEQLRNTQSFKTADLQAKGDGPLVQLLIDSKFQDLSKAVNELSNVVFSTDQSMHEEVLDTTKLLQKNLTGLGPLALKKIEHLQTIEKGVDQIITLLDSCMRKADCIRVRYVQNSSLLSSGDIIIEGQGGYISSITAGGEVIVTGKPGIARGVKITAHGNVTVKELGSEFDTQTSVKIKGNGKVSAELVHPNVVIQLGNKKFRVDSPCRNFDAYLNFEGRLVVDKLSAETKNK